MTLLEIMIVLAILALVMGLLVGPRVMDLFGRSKVGIAKMAVDKLENEAFPQWAAHNPGKACPESIADLRAYTNSKDADDPWGSPYKMTCPPIAVSSPGADGKEGTQDDIASR